MRSHSHLRDAMNMELQAFGAADTHTLWRECRKGKRLRRWESLPVAQLVPQNRPLFICQGCKFINTFLDKCPWCGCACVDVTIRPPVRRRVSSPLLLNDVQKDQLHRIEKRLIMDVIPEAAPLNTHLHPDQGRARSDACVGIFDVCISQECANEPQEGRRKRHRDAMVYSVDVATNNTNLRPTQTVILQTSSDTQRPRTTITSFSVDQYPDIEYPTKTCSFTSNPSDTASTTPSRTLRRKRRIAVLRKRSSCSLRRKSMTTIGSSMHKRSQSELTISHITKKPSRTQFGTPSLLPLDTSSVPLGHSTRPLYTAIRKNMSRPSSPSPSPPQPAFTSSTLERGMRSLDLPRPILGTSADPFPYPVGPFSVDLSTGAGFSLSGETELRMALARRRTVDGSGSPSGYKYHHRKEKEVGIGTMKGKVKKLGKGLKDLVNMWRS